MTDRISGAHWVRLAPTVFLLAWGGNHFTPLLHLYETEGNYAVWQANLLLGIYVAGLIPGLLVASALSDKHGRKSVTVAGMALAILGSVTLALGFHDFALLLVGRALAGVGVGVAMAVGTSWMKELSSPPFDMQATLVAGAKRPSLTLTLGFGMGAAVTGALAQWAPAPSVTPFVVHGALSVGALLLLFSVPESLSRRNRSTESWWRDLRVPAAGERRFRTLILPAAPWVFAAAGVAYAIMPSIVQDRTGDFATLFATILTVLTLGTGAVVQGFVPRINRSTRGRGIVVGLALMTFGMSLAVVASIIRDPVLVLVVAVVLGAAYGITVMSGLILVQSIATPRDLAGLTGVYYSLTYAGFLLPTLLAALLPVAPYSLLLVMVAVACAGSLFVVSMGLRRGRPHQA